MKTVAIYSLYPRDDIEYFGVPSRRYLALAIAGIAVGLALMQAILSVYFGVGSLELLAAGGAVLLAFYLLVAGLQTETAIQPGLLARRTWWQHALGRDGQLIRFCHGDAIERMADGKWLLGGVPLDLPNRGRDGRRLVSALIASGLVIEDRAAQWRLAHPRRNWCLRSGMPLAIVAWCAVFATCAYSDGTLHDVMNAIRLLGPVAMVAVGLAARAPRTKHRKVAPTIRHFHGPRHRRHRTPERMAA